MQFSCTLQAFKEVGLRKRIITALGNIAYAQSVCFEFLCAGKPCDIALPDLITQLVYCLDRLIAGAKKGRTQCRGKDTQLGDPSAILSLGCMGASDMTNLMTDNARKLSLIIRQCDQAARDIDVTTGKCEGVDNRTVENC